MMAQMFAKVTGLSKGRDSALHSGVNELGIFGNTSMLGANLPVAAGVGLTMKMEGKDSVCIAYFGEGASNTGDFHEALNFAGVNKLPIIFICENNLYAYSVPIEKSMAIEDVAVAPRAMASTASRSTATTCSPCIRRSRARAARARGEGRR
jgi:TPP-dependent pyruvate/acetoin dehydrogenase alpha subunit